MLAHTLASGTWSMCVCGGRLQVRWHQQLQNGQCVQRAVYVLSQAVLARVRVCQVAHNPSAFVAAFCQSAVLSGRDVNDVCANTSLVQVCRRLPSSWCRGSAWAPGADAAGLLGSSPLGACTIALGNAVGSRSGSPQLAHSTSGALSSAQHLTCAGERCSGHRSHDLHRGARGQSVHRVRLSALPIMACAGICVVVLAVSALQSICKPDACGKHTC
jgi:hypothetical protein